MARTNLIALVLCVFLALPASAYASADKDLLILPIGVYSEKFVPRPLSFSDGACPDVRKVDLHNNQVLAELILLCEALRLGGIKPAFIFKDTPDYRRIINDAAYAGVLMPGFVVWRADVNTELFYVSDPVLKEGEFVKGLYTVSTNKLLNIKSPRELVHFTAASNQNWVHDNMLIACITPELTTAGFNPLLMARLVAAGRADFLLFPFFNSVDLSGDLGGIPLVPVTGMKVVFNDSLHFIVSKEHPQGQQVYAALQRGLKQLHANGTLRYTYEKIGFFNPLIEDWIALGCEYQGELQ